MLAAAQSILESSVQTKQAFAESGLENVVQAAEMIAKAFADGKKLLIFGNGGSAADAQHFAGELINRFLLERPPLPAIALTTDTSVITSIGNDYSYDLIFTKQVKALGGEGDVAFGISTSGGSANVIDALHTARSRGMVTLGMTGSKPSDMDQLCDLLIKAPSVETPRIQEIHSLAVHIICELIDLKLFGRSR